jgi:hypothetical protein
MNEIAKVFGEHRLQSSMLSSQRDPEKIRSFFHKPSLRYAA